MSPTPQSDLGRAGAVSRRDLAASPEYSPEYMRVHTELFYDGRLEPRPDLAGHALGLPAPLAGSGLRFVEVPHQGCTNVSREEAEAAAALVDSILTADSHCSSRTPSAAISSSPATECLLLLGLPPVGERVERPAASPHQIAHLRERYFVRPGRIFSLDKFIFAQLQSQL